MLSEFFGRIGEQEIHGRSKELRFTDTEFGEKGFSESTAVDPEDDFITGFEEFQSVVSSGQRAEGSTRSTIMEDALRSLEIEESEPDIDPDIPSLDDLSPEAVEDIQSTTEAIFEEPEEGEIESESELDRGGEPDRPMDTAFETEPEQEPDIAEPVQEAEREAFRQVVEGEIESEFEPESEPELETEPAIDPENLLRTSFEQDQQLDIVQDDEADLGQVPELGQLQSPEQEVEPVQQLDPMQEPVEEPMQELFIEPEPELEPRRSPRPRLDFDENDGDISSMAEDPLSEEQDVEFAPSLEALVFDIRGEVDEDFEELTGLEVRPIDDDFEF